MADHLAGKATLLLCLLLLVMMTPLLSAVEGGISGDGLHRLQKGGFRIGSRKVLTLDAVLDYDYAGPNPKHDPRKGKPPGGRNP